MKRPIKHSGFTAVELLVTLFVAAAFLIAGFQLYTLIIKDGGESRAQARAANVAYDYLQRYKPTASNPCIASTPVNNQSITAANLSNVTVTVAITCPYGIASSVSKIAVNLNYNNPQQVISEATYVTQ
jgi:Tfp pilus assembly protein PilE